MRPAPLDCDIAKVGLVLCAGLLCLTGCTDSPGSPDPVPTQTEILANGGFEQGAALGGGLPTNPGVWGGDVFEYVSAENGVVPAEGRRMLKFIATSTTGGASGAASEAIQLVDVFSQYGVLIQSRNGLVIMTARFNRVAGDPSTVDTEFGGRIYAMPGVIADYPGTDLSAAALAIVDMPPVFSDSDPTSWESSSTVKLVLPRETGYLVVYVWAVENVEEDQTPPEFTGHYCDAVSAKITRLNAQ